MAIPDYQTLMLPILRLLGDGQVRRVVPDITDPVAEQFHLTLEEREQMLPSGLQATFVNRAHWAVTYMGKAGLITRPARGRVVNYGPRTRCTRQGTREDRRQLPDELPRLRRVSSQGETEGG